jgi:hypothetical protein
MRFIFDMDGTITNLDHRLHLIQNAPKKYDDFASEAAFDKPNWGTIRWIRALRAEHENRIVIVSARRQAQRPLTERWLHRYAVPYDELHLLRAERDFRKDRILKREWLATQSADDIAFVVDDRPSVISMWRSAGLRVFPVHLERWEQDEPLHLIDLINQKEAIA